MCRCQSRWCHCHAQLTRRCHIKMPHEDATSTDADTECINVDQCTESTYITEMESCAVNSSCADTDDSYESHYDFGWQNIDDNIDPEATCENIDGCADAESFECKDLSNCVNTNGTYLCSCIDGTPM